MKVMCLVEKKLMSLLLKIFNQNFDKIKNENFPFIDY